MTIAWVKTEHGSWKGTPEGESGPRFHVGKNRDKGWTRVWVYSAADAVWSMLGNHPFPHADAAKAYCERLAGL